MVDEIFCGLIGGTLGDLLAKLAPPRKTSEFDNIPYEDLRRRNNWIDLSSIPVFWGTLIIIFALLVNIGTNHNWWRAGFLFFFPFTIMILFICLVTLPKGVRRFREFWRFHELRQRTRLAVLLSLYVPLAVFGMVSALKSF